MGMGLETTEHYVKLSIPLHHNVDNLIYHLRTLADKLEAIKNQSVPEGKICPMTNTDSIDQISIQHTPDYFFLELDVFKNYNFSLIEFDRHVK